MLISSPLNVMLRNQEAQALQDLISLSKAEESFTRQKSRAIWMKDGDRNSKYFHGCMKDRVNNNKIISLEMEDGSRVFKPSEIHSAAIGHFQKLFTDPDSNYSASDLDRKSVV